MIVSSRALEKTDGVHMLCYPVMVLLLFRAKKAGTQNKRHKAFRLLSGQAHSFLDHPVYPFVNFLHVLGWTMTLLFLPRYVCFRFYFFRFFLFSLFFFTFLLSSPNPFPSLVLFSSPFLLLLLLPPPPPPSSHLTSPHLFPSSSSSSLN